VSSILGIQEELTLIENLIKSTLEMQGFRIESVKRKKGRVNWHCLFFVIYISMIIVCNHVRIVKMDFRLLQEGDDTTQLRHLEGAESYPTN